jgi:hypothetical protein
MPQEWHSAWEDEQHESDIAGPETVATTSHRGRRMWGVGRILRAESVVVPPGLSYRATSGRNSRIGRVPALLANHPSGVNPARRRAHAGTNCRQLGLQRGSGPADGSGPVAIAEALRALVPAQGACCVFQGNTLRPSAGRATTLPFFITIDTRFDPKR